MPAALVTGAGKRLGRSMCLALAKKGYDLFLHVHKSVKEAKVLALEIEQLGQRAEIISEDLLTPKGQDALCKKVLESTLGLDLIVHSASLFKCVPFDRITREELQAMHQIHVEAPFFITQKLSPKLKVSQNPNIVFMLDSQIERAYPAYAHYAATKAGALSLMRTLSVALAPEVRVNAIAPGAVLFPEDFEASKKQAILAKVPLRRSGGSENVTQALMAILDNNFMSGNVINLDGARAQVA